MLDLQTITPLASMAYITSLRSYGLHTWDEKSSTSLLMNSRVLHCIYNWG